MNCQEFDEGWDELFDARGEAPAHLERRMDEHASSCPRCRPTSDRNQLLRHAIAGLRAPMPSPGSIDRLHTLTYPSARPSIGIATTRPARRPWKPMAAAAAFALAWLGGDCWPHREPAEVPQPNLSVTSIPRRPLGLALTEAAEGMLDLARKTSEPASRFSREFLELNRPAVQNSDFLANKIKQKADAEADIETADGAASGLIRAMGDGVKPLPGVARHAFGFLRGLADSTAPTPASGRRDSL